MYKSTSKLKILFLVCLVAVSCAGDKRESATLTASSSIATQDVAFATAVPFVEMNTLMSLRYSSEFSKGLKIGSLISFLIENQSQESIIFPVDYGISVFVYSEEARVWNRIGDRNTYVGSTEPVLAPKGVVNLDTNSIWQLVVNTHPDIANTGKPVNVRVVVVGHVYKNGVKTDKKAGAYTDVKLQP